MKAVSARHPLVAVEGLLSDDQLRPFASLCMTDTSRNLPKVGSPTASDGFHMPAEWAAQTQTWMIWPERLGVEYEKT